MRDAVAGLALVVLAAACGGGSSAANFEDVKPCLDRLALVAAHKFTGTVTTPTGGVTTLAASPGVDVVDWSVDLAYRNPTRGANAAHLSFFKSKDAAKAEVTRAHVTARSASSTATLNPNFRRMLGRAAVVGDSAVLTWSSDPTAQQKRRLRACFD